jgi:hypothetical protein
LSRRTSVGITASGISVTNRPIDLGNRSSGTSGGQPKLMPSTEEELDRKTFLYNLLVPVMNK